MIYLIPSQVIELKHELESKQSLLRDSTNDYCLQTLPNEQTPDTTMLVNTRDTGSIEEYTTMLNDIAVQTDDVIISTREMTVSQEAFTQLLLQLKTTQELVSMKEVGCVEVNGINPNIMMQ